MTSRVELEQLLGRIAALYREIPARLAADDFDGATELDAERGRLVRRVFEENFPLGDETRHHVLQSLQAMQQDLMHKAVAARERVEQAAASERRGHRAVGSYAAAADEAG